MAVPRHTARRRLAAACLVAAGALGGCQAAGAPRVGVAGAAAAGAAAGGLIGAAMGAAVVPGMILGAGVGAGVGLVGASLR